MAEFLGSGDDASLEESPLGTGFVFVPGTPVELYRRDGSMIFGSVASSDAAKGVVYIFENGQTVPYNYEYLCRHTFTKKEYERISRDPNLHQKRLSGYFEMIKESGGQPKSTKDLLSDPERFFEPQEMIEIDGLKFYIGKVFFDENFSADDRVYAVMMVEGGWMDGIKGKTVPRLLYKSKSGGSWRGARDINSEGIFGKGWVKNNPYHSYAQETKLCEALTVYLERAEKKAEPKHVHEGDEFILSKYFARERVREEGLDTYELTYHVPRSYEMNDLAGVFRETAQSSSKYLMTRSDLDVRLEALKYPPGFIPDFKRGPVRQYETRHLILGPVNNLVYPAMLDGRRIEWTMCYDREGRVWIGSIVFVDGNINSYGLNMEVIPAGILVNKPVDYGRNLPHPKFCRELNTPNYRTADEVEAWRKIGSENPMEYAYFDVTPLLDHLRPVREFRESFRTA